MEEAHPIPQNVTSFEFHLVGDMTLKQFGYLAAGLVSAYLTFVIFFPIAPIVAAPFILIFAILGAAYAFVPILDRPLDHWTKAFFKAVYSPTKGNWRSPQDPKIKISPDDPIFKDRLKNYLANLKPTKPNDPITEEKPLEATPNKNLISQLNNDINSKPVVPIEKPKQPEPIKIKLTQDELTEPHLVEPLKDPLPTLKPLKIAPENNLSSQTLQSVKQDIASQNKTIPLPSTHENFTPSKFPAFADGQIDFSPQNNPDYQHLQFVYEAPILKNESVHNLPIHQPTFASSPMPVNTTPQPKIGFNQPIPSTPPQSSVNSLFTSVSLPNQTVQPNPLKINSVNLTPTPQPIPTQPNIPAPATTSTPKPIASTTSLPSSEELNKLVELAKEARLLQVKLEEAEKRIKDITTNATSSDVTKPVSADRFDAVYSKLQNLITQTDSLNKEAAEVHKVIPPAAKPSPVKVVAPIKPQTTQPVLTSQPNVINGIVTDNSGNYLEGVIIIIHDKDGLPVRALKTNKIGQFTGTTPLPGGVYTITLEKEHLDFDTLEVNLNGEIIPPLQVSAKGGAVAHA